MSKAELLKLRRNIKSKKPEFLRQESRKRKKLAKVWRKPKGRHSKQREMRRGHYLYIQHGYSSPREVRGLDRNGLMPVRVFTLDALKALNPKENSAIIAASVGMKKKLEMLKAAEQMKLAVLNIKDIAAYSKKADAIRAALKDSRVSKAKDKKAKEEASKKKVKEESIDKKLEKPAEPAATDEQKLAEKKERDKFLTQNM